MRVLTRTYPPTINANYGGILQAWALQQALSTLGHEGWVDATKSSAPPVFVAWLRRRMTEVRDGLARLNLLPRRYQPEAVRWAANRQILSFASSNFRLCRVYRGGRRIDAGLLHSFDAFVTGSDQVWRPDFVDVSSYLLDFLDEDDLRPRFSYAASFGSSSPKGLFSQQSREKLSTFAKRLTAVSVREESGVELCAELWGVRPTRVIDPTMLLSAEDYDQLILGESVTSAGLAAYVLDADPSVSERVDELGRTLGVTVTPLFHPLPKKYRDFARDRATYSRVGVGVWLDTIKRSSYVLTDSFHGTVFAILFNKPFLIVPNHKRGLARFETLLSIFDLSERVAQLDGGDDSRMRSPIDWEIVNSRISFERARGLQFLAEALESDLDPMKRRSSEPRSGNRTQT